MIKRFIRRVLGLDTPGPVRVPQSRHGIQRESISSGALKVCDVLADHGHAAYVVGGAVRDLLLNIDPKDFDIATDARLEPVGDVNSHRSSSFVKRISSFVSRKRSLRH